MRTLSELLGLAIAAAIAGLLLAPQILFMTVTGLSGLIPDETLRLAARGVFDLTLWGTGAVTAHLAGRGAPRFRRLRVVARVPCALALTTAPALASNLTSALLGPEGRAESTFSESCLRVGIALVGLSMGGVAARRRPSAATHAPPLPRPPAALSSGGPDTPRPHGGG